MRKDKCFQVGLEGIAGEGLSETDRESVFHVVEPRTEKEREPKVESLDRAIRRLKASRRVEGVCVMVDR